MSQDQGQQHKGGNGEVHNDGTNPKTTASGNWNYQHLPSPTRTPRPLRRAFGPYCNSNNNILPRQIISKALIRNRLPATILSESAQQTPGSTSPLLADQARSKGTAKVTSSSDCRERTGTGSIQQCVSSSGPITARRSAFGTGPTGCAACGRPWLNARRRWTDDIGWTDWTDFESFVQQARYRKDGCCLPSRQQPADGRWLLSIA